MINCLILCVLKFIPVKFKINILHYISTPDPNETEDQHGNPWVFKERCGFGVPYETTGY